MGPDCSNKDTANQNLPPDVLVAEQIFSWQSDKKLSLSPNRRNKRYNFAFKEQFNSDRLSRMFKSRTEAGRNLRIYFETSKQVSLASTCLLRILSFTDSPALQFMTTESFSHECMAHSIHMIINNLHDCTPSLIRGLSLFLAPEWTMIVGVQLDFQHYMYQHHMFLNMHCTCRKRAWKK